MDSDPTHQESEASISELYNQIILYGDLSIDGEDILSNSPLIDFKLERKSDRDNVMQRILAGVNSSEHQIQHFAIKIMRHVVTQFYQYVLSYDQILIDMTKTIVSSTRNTKVVQELVEMWFDLAEIELSLSLLKGKHINTSLDQVDDDEELDNHSKDSNGSGSIIRKHSIEVINVFLQLLSIEKEIKQTENYNNSNGDMENDDDSNAATVYSCLALILQIVNDESVFVPIISSFVFQNISLQSLEQENQKSASLDSLTLLLPFESCLNLISQSIPMILRDLSFYASSNQSTNGITAITPKTSHTFCIFKITEARPELMKNHISEIFMITSLLDFGYPKNQSILHDLFYTIVLYLSYEGPIEEEDENHEEQSYQNGIVKDSLGQNSMSEVHEEHVLMLLQSFKKWIQPSKNDENRLLNISNYESAPSLFDCIDSIIVKLTFDWSFDILSSICVDILNQFKNLPKKHKHQNQQIPEAPTTKLSESYSSTSLQSIIFPILAIFSSCYSNGRLGLIPTEKTSDLLEAVVERMIAESSDVIVTDESKTSSSSTSSEDSWNLVDHLQEYPILLGNVILASEFLFSGGIISLPSTLIPFIVDIIGRFVMDKEIANQQQNPENKEKSSPSHLILKPSSTASQATSPLLSTPFLNPNQVTQSPGGDEEELESKTVTESKISTPLTLFKSFLSLIELLFNVAHQSIIAFIPSLRHALLVKIREFQNENPEILLPLCVSLASIVRSDKSSMGLCVVPLLKLVKTILMRLGSSNDPKRANEIAQNADQLQTVLSSILVSLPKNNPSKTNLLQDYLGLIIDVIKSATHDTNSNINNEDSDLSIDHPVMNDDAKFQERVKNGMCLIVDTLSFFELSPMDPVMKERFKSILEYLCDRYNQEDESAMEYLNNVTVLLNK